MDASRGSAAGTRTAADGSVSTAALLSFVLPGLGQAAAGAHRRGVLIAVPAIVIGLAGVVIAASGTRALDLLLEPSTVVGLLVLNVVLGAYHLVAVADAYRRAARGRRVGRAARLVTAVLLAGTLALHGAIEVVGLEVSDTLDTVLVPADLDGGSPVTSVTRTV